jgi:hypothetical protein
MVASLLILAVDTQIFEIADFPACFNVDRIALYSEAVLSYYIARIQVNRSWCEELGLWRFAWAS